MKGSDPIGKGAHLYSNLGRYGENGQRGSNRPLRGGWAEGIQPAVRGGGAGTSATIAAPHELVGAPL
jgi:hypothetical protein